MALQQKLQVKLSHKLILTPSLQQALKMLPMSTVELADMMNQEMVENPLLDEGPIDESPPTEGVQQEEKVQEASTDLETSGADETWDEADYEYFFGEYLDEGFRRQPNQGARDLPPLENTLSTATSLADHLTWQLSSSQYTETVQEISAAIIGNLNEGGQLAASTEELCSMGSWSEGDVATALGIVQHFDPVGVAARNLQECLLLQLRHLGFAGTITERIVVDHLDLLQKRRLPDLAKILGLSVDETKQHVDVISHLDPKPGDRYNPSVSQHVIPDVFVVKGDDGFTALVNNEGLPQLRISTRYRRLLDRRSQDDADTRAYVREKFRSALWLLKSIDQRQQTIQKVADSIVKFQLEFLERSLYIARMRVAT